MISANLKKKATLVLLLGLFATLAVPRPSEASEAYRVMEACSWTCPEDLCQGGTCEEEDCYDNENKKRPYVLRCNEV